MDVIRLTADCKVSQHQYPEGGYDVTHKFLTELIGPSCRNVEEVNPVGLYEEGLGFDMDIDKGTAVIMLVDEEGLLKELDVNPVASYLYGAQNHGQLIVGNVLFIGLKMTEDGPDFSGIGNEDVYNRLYDILSKCESKEETA